MQEQRGKEFPEPKIRIQSDLLLSRLFVVACGGAEPPKEKTMIIHEDRKVDFGRFLLNGDLFRVCKSIPGGLHELWAFRMWVPHQSMGGRWALLTSIATCRESFWTSAQKSLSGTLTQSCLSPFCQKLFNFTAFRYQQLFGCM